MGALAWVSVPLGFFCFVSFVVDSVSTKRFWIVCWLLGGVVFLVSFCFAATRCWLPFIVPYWLLMRMNKPKKYWLGLMAVVSVHLVWDDAQLARAQHQLAKQTVDYCKSQYGDQGGYFAGHWGWQYALEGSGWLPVEDDSIIPNNVCFSVSTVSWPLRK